MTLSLFADSPSARPSSTFNNSGLQLFFARLALPRRICRGQFLYTTGSHECSLFMIRTGWFKTTLSGAGGDERVVGFHMAGNLLGLDGIARNRRSSNVIALEDGEVIEIQLSQLLASLAVRTDLLQAFLETMSSGIASGQTMMSASQMRAEQRFAAFLCKLSHEHALRGFSASAMQLRMSREDIGSFLGLTNSSISRLIAKFRLEGLIDVRHRDLRILSIERLKMIANGLQPVKE